MMKFFCFLVLVTSSVSRGQSQTADLLETHHETTDSSQLSAQTSTPPSKTEPEPETTGPTLPSPSPHTSEFPKTFTTQYDMTTTNKDMRQEVSNSTAAPATATGGRLGREEDDDADGITMVSMAMGSTLKPVTIEDQDPSSWGYVFLVFILLVIVVLCFILFLLRRASRMYSFDLQSPVPAKHPSDPTGTFEPVYLDDLDRPAPKDQMISDDLSPPSVANGTTLQSGEQGSDGESSTDEQPNPDGLETTLTGKTSPPLGDEPVYKTSPPLSTTNLFLDAAEEEQLNENNNNLSICSSHPFVEINLDDPTWCQQLLNPPEAPPSVLFSPFSFSSSSSQHLP